MSRVLGPDDRLEGERVVLRLVRESDCTDRYQAWLADADVNRYLETRWREQTLPAIRTFVRDMLASPDNYLFAILEREGRDETHVGNIKVGPVNWHHLHADVSYFIGERSRWGRGLATDAIRVASDFGFRKLGLHRLQAGLYAGNAASARALERAGYRLDGKFDRQLRGPMGWEDHVWYRALAEEWLSQDA